MPGPLVVVVLAPVGRDAALATHVLGDAVPVVLVQDAAGLAEAVGRPDLGAVVLTTEALAVPGVVEGLSRADRPAWSEIPVVLFVDDDQKADRYLAAADRFGPGVHLTLMTRPIGAAAFRSVVALALRGRRQQLRVRDLLQRLGQFTDELEARVDAQTAQLRERADEARALARALSRAEDRERERVAQLLHDDLQQVLVGLKMHVSLLGTPGATADLPQRIAGFADEAITQTRNLSADLGPPSLDAEGLGGALRWVADDAEHRYGLVVHLDVVDDPAPPAAARAMLTRAARELLLNVVKHADSGEAWVRTWCEDDECRLEVRDRGAGAPDTERTGRGLGDLRRRATLLGGEVEVRSERGVGTAVRISVPMAE
ncbi:sensor histidine kinase [Rubrivirga sp. IMCC45206]|uniref:sensor histidine kinase n=1 Tax=Rubrivirga sp. IMCC45206 TaxID=3391614 RepID=UPI003990170E